MRALNLDPWSFPHKCFSDPPFYRHPSSTPASPGAFPRRLEFLLDPAFLHFLCFILSLSVFGGFGYVHTIPFAITFYARLYPISLLVEAGRVFNEMRRASTVHAWHFGGGRSEHQ